MKRIAGGKLAVVIKIVKISAITLILPIALLSLIRGWPKPALKDAYAASTALYDSHGKLLRLTLSSDEKYRLWESLKDMSPLLVEGTLLYEDQYFYHHPGVNPVALIRSAAQTYVTGGRQIDGSVTVEGTTWILHKSRVGEDGPSHYVLFRNLGLRLG